MVLAIRVSLILQTFKKFGVPNSISMNPTVSAQTAPRTTKLSQGVPVKRANLPPRGNKMR